MSFAVKTGLAAALTLGALGFGVASASAMPLGLDAGVSAAATSPQVDNVRWVCGYYGRHCRWIPNHHAPRWGWGHHWRHW